MFSNTILKKFIIYQQLNAMDCGPTCLKMVSKHYGKNIDTNKLRQLAGYSKEGVSLLGICDAAEGIGFRARGVQIDLGELFKNRHLPCILHWNQNHFVVLPPQKFRKRRMINVADPSKGLIKYELDEFTKQWAGNINSEGQSVGIALLLEPTAEFYAQEEKNNQKLVWSQVFSYLNRSKWQLSQVFLALMVTSIFQLIFPFLTQSIVDAGINTQNIQYIIIVLVAQFTLVFSRSVVEFIRSRLLLYISVNLNFSLLSDFWIKLTRLPMGYFDSHHTGDLLQRLGDSKRIESFLTGSALNTFFSLFNFLIFAVVLMLYNQELFFIFSIGSILYFIWIRFFLSIRRKINFQNFYLSSKENGISLQLIQGMQELKLNNAEHLKRWEWEGVQAALFKINFKVLSYNQIQQIGALLINEGKNIVITFMVAQMVIQGKLTFGAMLAVQYIIGQLNGPVEQFIGFVQSAQDAKISLERLNEIHLMEQEEQLSGVDAGIMYLPEQRGLFFRDFSFSYPGGGNDPVLEKINLEIPHGKTTAIVGVSGSGKTTLLKVLLKFYEKYEGTILVGENLQFKYISPAYWRRQCGAVLQDGFIFNDTIAQNIAVGFEQPDIGKLISACRTANILSYIESLPNGFNTRLGMDGVGISQGQRQRLLIARAIYKDPQYLLFDEATNALDANNEKVIVENLQSFFKGRTVIVVAHRLSTVKHSDKIIVLDKGRIVEEGTHLDLSSKRGKYYELVKNQLELGN